MGHLHFVITTSILAKKCRNFISNISYRNQFFDNIDAAFKMQIVKGVKALTLKH